MQLKHLIFTNSLIDFAVAASALAVAVAAVSVSAAHFAVEEKLLKTKLPEKEIVYSGILQIKYPNRCRQSLPN